MYFRIIVLMLSMMMTSLSFAGGTAACKIDELNSDEICMVSNPASKHLSLRKLDVDEMKGFDNLSSEEQSELIAQVNAHNKTREKIDKVHAKLGEMLFSSFVVIVLFLISSGASLGEYYRAGKQTRGTDGLIIGSFFAICLVAAMDARSGGYGARELRDIVEIKLEEIRQHLTYESIKSVRTNNSLDDTELKEALDKQSEAEKQKINFNLDLSRFMLNNQISFYRTNTVILENKMDFMPENTGELSSQMIVLTPDMIKPIYSTVEYTDKTYSTPTPSGVYSGAVDTDETDVTFTAAKYISGFEVKDAEEKAYGKAILKNITITDKTVLKNVDFDAFITSIRSGSGFEAAVEPALENLTTVLKNEDGDLTKEAKRVIMTTALNLAQIAKSEMIYQEATSIVDQVNTAMNYAIEAYCIDRPDYVRASKEYLSNMIAKPKAYSCIIKEGDAVKLIGLDKSGKVYDALSVRGEQTEHKEEVMQKFKDQMINIEISSSSSIQELYKDFINYQRKVLGAKENEDFYVSRGGAQFGGFLSEKIMASNFDYAFELQEPVNLNSLSDEYYINLKDKAELNRVAPNLYLEASTMLNKKFIGDMLSEISEYRENKEFTYENLNNQQMNNKLTQDVSVVESTNAGGFSLMGSMFERVTGGMSAVYDLGHSEDGPNVFRTPMSAFKETIKDTKGMAAESINSVTNYLAIAMVAEAVTSYSMGDGAGIKDTGKGAIAGKSLGFINTLASWSTQVLLILFSILAILLVVMTFIIKVVLEAPNLIFGFFSLSILVASIQMMLLPYLMGLFAFVGFSKGEKVRQMKLVGLFLVMGFMFVTGAFLVAAVGMLLYNPMVMILAMGAELLYSSIQNSFAEGGAFVGMIGMAVSVIIIVTSSLGYLVFIMRFFWTMIAKIIAEVPQFDNQVDLFAQIEKDIDAVSDIEQRLLIVNQVNGFEVYDKVSTMQRGIQKTANKQVQKGIDKGSKLIDKISEKVKSDKDTA